MSIDRQWFWELQIGKLKACQFYFGKNILDDDINWRRNFEISSV